MVINKCMVWNKCKSKIYPYNNLSCHYIVMLYYLIMNMVCLNCTLIYLNMCCSDRVKSKHDDPNQHRQYGVSGSGAKQSHLVVAPQALQPGQQPQQLAPGAGVTTGGGQQLQYYYYPAGYQYDTSNAGGAQSFQATPQTPQGQQTMHQNHQSSTLQHSGHTTRGQAPVLNGQPGMVNGHANLVNGQVTGHQGAVVNGQVSSGAAPQQAGYADPSVYVSGGQHGGYSQEQGYNTGGVLPSQYTQPQSQRLQGTQGSSRRYGDRYADPAWRGDAAQETWAGDDPYYSHDPYQEDINNGEGYTYGDNTHGQSKYRSKHRSRD